MQIELEFEVDPLIRLSTIEEIIRKKQIMVPVPHRKTLIAWIEEGILDGLKGDDNWWYVRKSSFIAWARAKQER